MRLTLIIISALFLATSLNAMLNVNFDTPGDLAAKFTVAGGSGTASEADGVGFNGTRGITNATATRVHGFVVPTSFEGTLASWETKALWNPGTNTNTHYTLGFTVDSAPLFSASTPVSVENTGDIANVYGSIYSEFAAGGNNVQSTETGAGPINRDQNLFSLAANTWYEISLSVTYNGANSYTATATTSSVDGAGNPISALVSSSATFDNISLAGDSEVYTYFSIGDTNGSLDNFSTTAVPEISSLSLIACMGSFFALFYSRRRQQ